MAEEKVKTEDQKKADDKASVEAGAKGLPAEAVKAECKVNELCFLTGETVELKGLPFVVSGITGLKIELKRKDLK